MTRTTGQDHLGILFLIPKDEDIGKVGALQVDMESPGRFISTYNEQLMKISVPHSCTYKLRNRPITELMF